MIARILVSLYAVPAFGFRLVFHGAVSGEGRLDRGGQEEGCGQQAGNGIDVMKHGVNGEFIFRKRGYGAGA